MEIIQVCAVSRQDRQVFYVVIPGTTPHRRVFLYLMVFPDQGTEIHSHCVQQYVLPG